MMVGIPRFGDAYIETMFIHHPAHLGLANVLEPETIPKAHRRVGFPHAENYAAFMCKHDVVALESVLLVANYYT